MILKTWLSRYHIEKPEGSSGEVSESKSELDLPALRKEASKSQSNTKGLDTSRYDIDLNPGDEIVKVSGNVLNEVNKLAKKVPESEEFDKVLGSEGFLHDIGNLIMTFIQNITVKIPDEDLKTIAKRRGKRFGNPESYEKPTSLNESTIPRSLNKEFQGTNLSLTGDIPGMDPKLAYFSSQEAKDLAKQVELEPRQNWKKLNIPRMINIRPGEKPAYFLIPKDKEQVVRLLNMIRNNRVKLVSERDIYKNQVYEILSNPPEKPNEELKETDREEYLSQMEEYDKLRQEYNQRKKQNRDKNQMLNLLTKVVGDPSDSERNPDNTKRVVRALEKLVSKDNILIKIEKGSIYYYETTNVNRGVDGQTPFQPGFLNYNLN